jgi:hypothetical protein
MHFFSIFNNKTCKLQRRIRKEKREIRRKRRAVVVGGGDGGGDGSEGVLGDFVFSFLPFLFFLPPSYL